MSDNLNGNPEEKTIVREEKEPHVEPDIQLKTKPVPIIIVLIAAAVTCVLSIIQQVDFSEFFFRLLKTVLIFAVIACIVKMVLDRIFNYRRPEDAPLPEEDEEVTQENIDIEPDEGQLMDEEEQPEEFGEDDAG